jgi:phage terminase large subunit-like protein
MPSGRKTDYQDPTPGPWERWKGSYHGKVIRFIETYCRSPKGEGHGKPIRLAPFQREDIEAMFAPGIDVAVESFPRGNGKSTAGAGLCVASTFLPHESGAPQVPIIATTVGQAIRSVYGTAAWMVNAELELKNRSLSYSGVGQARVRVTRTGGEMFPIANAEAQIQGLDPSFALADEIGFQPMSAWGGLVQAGGKRSRSLILGMGTPGIDHENALFQVRELVMKGQIERLYFREYAAIEGCSIEDREQWRLANPAIGAGFLRESALELDLRLMPAARFRIFRLGQWVEGVESWLGDHAHILWRQTEDDYGLVKGAPTWIGVDAAITRDTTAVVAVQLRDGGRLHASARFWVPKRDEPTDVSDVMAYVRHLADLYKVGAVAYDPRFLDWPAKILHDEGIPMVEISQGVDRMTPIIGDLYTLIREGGITHDRDPMFAQHVVGAVARHNERGFTLKKADSRGHIDGCIALALAVSQYRGRQKPRSKLVLL